VLSCDPDCDPGMTALFGSSLALCVSNIPFNGPVSGVIVGKVDGQLIINPTEEQVENSTLNLTVAGTKEAINMVEAGAKEVSEEEMLEALMFGHAAIKELCAIQDEVIAACAKPKMEVVLYEINPLIREYIDAHGKDRIIAAVSTHGTKDERYGAVEAVIEEMAEQVGTELTWDTEKELEKAKQQAPRPPFPSPYFFLDSK
jgi:polyribonucleotide nucleotidyltransferase